MSRIRVRFAPSPTGGLHLGGVRTALFSYLYARHHQGDFVLRIEDTDQNRFVEGAEKYIQDTLDWCGFQIDESPSKGGLYAPYRQSERKEIYHKYAWELVEKGYAYIAFDTKEDIEAMRENYAVNGNHAQYDSTTRMKMKNSLSLVQSTIDEMLQKNEPYVIRIKTPENEIINFEDIVRGNVSVQSHLLDDKVLLKADGMPTYHLAVVVDDYLMKISHVFRGEEWLPSAPIHVLLWRYLGWENQMPAWAHLPLILKPDGKGKLSKRDAEKLGIPVFAMDWKDPKTNDFSEGFKEKGFLPEAFLNMLLMLGWNSGTEKEVYSINEMIADFDETKIVKHGAKFDFKKALWYNQQHIHQMTDDVFWDYCKTLYEQKNWNFENKGKLVSALIKDRCTLLSDIESESYYFFEDIEIKDLESIKSKWNEPKQNFFAEFLNEFMAIESMSREELEQMFKAKMELYNLKAGDVMLPLRMMLVGEKKGPDVFAIATLLGKEKVNQRILTTLKKLNS